MNADEGSCPGGATELGKAATGDASNPFGVASGIAVLCERHTEAQFRVRNRWGSTPLQEVILAITTMAEASALAAVYNAAQDLSAGLMNIVGLVVSTGNADNDVTTPGTICDVLMWTLRRLDESEVTSDEREAIAIQLYKVGSRAEWNDALFLADPGADDLDRVPSDAVGDGLLGTRELVQIITAFGRSRFGFLTMLDREQIAQALLRMGSRLDWDVALTTAGTDLDVDDEP